MGAGYSAIPLTLQPWYICPECLHRGGIRLLHPRRGDDSRCRRDVGRSLSGHHNRHSGPNSPVGGWRAARHSQDTRNADYGDSYDHELRYIGRLVGSGSDPGYCQRPIFRVCRVVCLRFGQSVPRLPLYRAGALHPFRAGNGCHHSIDRGGQRNRSGAGFGNYNPAARTGSRRIRFHRRSRSGNGCQYRRGTMGYRNHDFDDGHRPQPDARSSLPGLRSNDGY